MQFLENYSLRQHNTFGIDARARYFAGFSSVEELQELAEQAFPRQRVNPQLVLGGGSNILLTGNLDGWVFHNQVRGIELVKEDENHAWVTVGAGENWHQFVLNCIEHNRAGVENLSLIPGSVGAAPLQNIGAYGVELRDSFHSLQAWDMNERRIVEFSLNDCEFGYRESIFKKQAKGQFIILRVTFQLNKHPEFRTTYGAIQHELDRMNITSLSIRAISDAVIRIRQSKLPDPAKFGNAGSFFKNPSVSGETYKHLKDEFPGIVAYQNPDGSMKLAAGWLIEQCGWKGFRNGDAGCHAQQALVLVNYGNATGQEILALSRQIQDSVKDKFGVELEREVNVVGSTY